MKKLSWSGKLPSLYFISEKHTTLKEKLYLKATPPRDDASATPIQSYELPASRSSTPSS